MVARYLRLVAHVPVIRSLARRQAPSATDAMLNRDVAIKVLPPAIAKDPEHLVRCTR
jgi:hypothetical protein